MVKQPGLARLVVEVTLFLLCMALALGALGLGTGWPELALWAVFVVAGTTLILRGHARRRDRWASTPKV